MTVYPTAVSLAGAVIYLAVTALCVLAWTSARKTAAGRSRFRPGWLAIAALFALLALNRILVIEDRFDNFLRDVAREIGAYDGRTAWQGPLSLAAVLLVVTVVSIAAMAWRRSRADRGRRALAVAQLAAFAMLGLIAVRLISLHEVDSLLYGGLRLNWWLDIGITLVVGAAAWIGWKAERD